ncbi:Uroporphyrinogen decarboxylase in heme biosynthesis [Haplosporangium bisporale]|nr:Uroporphyrinogen decarboxylase in heme biosynthesis [Haplosporangium bisporale]KFH66527.1 uroporphyrinogen decarboxylase [Podila verticillata NRRL 6337]
MLINWSTLLLVPALFTFTQALPTQLPFTSPCRTTASPLTTKPFPPLKNDLIIRAARGEKTERPPVWVMRQAGRYLPEFRKVREEHNFFAICRTPALATQVTLQPIDRFDGLLDAAIIFSDILVIPQAFGLEVVMPPGQGPHFPSPLKGPKDMGRLKEKIDIRQDLGYVLEAITMTRHALDGRVPLIGFVGGPWTLMAYMVEGGGSRMFSLVKEWIFKYPEESHELLQRITDVCVDFLVEQVRAGAQMLQVFDSWSGELGPHEFSQFSLPYLRQIAERVKGELGSEAVPMTIFAKGSWYALEELSTSGYDTVSLDWTHIPAEAKRITRGRVTLQGNLEPSVFLGDDESIAQATEKMVREFGGQRYIANLGHGILPGVRIEAMEVFLKTVHRVGRVVAIEEEAEVERHEKEW